MFNAFSKIEAKKTNILPPNDNIFSSYTATNASKISAKFLTDTDNYFYFILLLLLC